MAEDTVPETPADKLESEFSYSNFAREFLQRNQKKYEVKSLAFNFKCACVNYWLKLLHRKHNSIIT